MRKSVIFTLLLLLLVGFQAILLAAPRVMALSDRKATRKALALAKLAPVTVETVQGSEFKRLTLTSKAAQRIDLQTAQVREESISRRRIVPGEAMVTPSTQTVVTATADGVVTAPDGGLPAAGAAVAANATVLRLALATQSPPTARKNNTRQVGLNTPENGSQAARTLNVLAPKSAVVSRIFVTAGQRVQAGDKLFALADSVSCMLKVPQVSDLAKIDQDAAITVLPMNATGGSTSMAKRVAAPAMMPDAEDKDGKDAKEAKDVGRVLYYTVDGAEPCARSSQRVRVAYDLSAGTGPRLVIPYAALVYDAGGKAWVYTNPQPLAFMRHPVTVDFVEGDIVVLNSGPPSKTQIVTTGAMQLYGSEFFVGH